MLPEHIKVVLWLQTQGRLIHYKYWRLKPIRDQLDIRTSEETIAEIVKNRTSVSRYGDGEFQIVERYLREQAGETLGEVDTFQHYNQTLGQRLHQILIEPAPSGFLTCIPYSLKDSKVLSGYARTFFEREALIRLRTPLFQSIRSHTFYDASFTRFYMDRADIHDHQAYISSLKEIWRDQDILMVEGEKSRCGIGNNLFDSARSLERVLCPATNAFDKYEEILTQVKGFGQGKLILIALGQTATVLAYDLHLAGHWAIDLGHLDVEYEWYRMRAKNKVAIQGKYVNEVKEGRIVSLSPDEEKYQKQIIARIL